MIADPTQHPRRDNKNNIVTLTNPSTATIMTSWRDATKIATCIPDGSVPETLNDLNLIPWAGAPKTVQGWNFVQGINQTLEEEQLQSINGKKLSAGAVVVESDGRVWVVHPSNQFGGYVTTFPKGRVDNRLSLQATAIKEVFEESGLYVEIMEVLGDFERTTSVTRYYLARRLAGTPADMGWESQAVSLVPPEKLDSMLNGPADKPVLAALNVARISLCQPNAQELLVKTKYNSDSDEPMTGTNAQDVDVPASQLQLGKLSEKVTMKADLPVDMQSTQLGEGELSLIMKLYGLQKCSSTGDAKWQQLEPEMDEFAKLLTSDDLQEVIPAIGDDWWLEIGPVNLGDRIVTIQRGDTLIAAITATEDGRLRVAVFRPLDGKSAEYLTGLGKLPHPEHGVCMRENNWEYALDCSAGNGNVYASYNGEAYLSYWEKGLGIRLDGTDVPIWRKQQDLVCRPAARVVTELTVYTLSNYETQED
ncbi:NUDIX hydrolase [Scandinavium sp. H11S7]|uniref:NUDIX hydrolase n=1 Tax=Scandinavium hiltneri TaxID=2926519 RepID=A0ABT2E422_9ENTR|nr:NUDIX hydrolase [Scandinavium hiltneri]MCS2162619.1 NUDIX hydrolase [Scandinavium hiltneri]